MYDILIRDITVLPMTEQNSVLELYDVAIKGQHIVDMGPSGTIDSEAQHIITGTHQVLLPGLVNCHTHVGATIFRGTTEAMKLKEWLEFGTSLLEQLTPEDFYWSSLLGCCEMIRAGITTFVDTFFYNDSLDLLKEAYLSAVIHPWQEGSTPASRCLAMATKEGARALALEHEIGTVEIGKKADLIIMDINGVHITPIYDIQKSIIYAGRASDVRTVIIDGRVVLDEGILTTVDEENVMEEVSKRARKVLERL